MRKTMTFEPVTWNASLATGISEIDKQHQYLINTLQLLNEQFQTNGHQVLLSRITRDLQSYALTHFDTEETLMIRYGYTTNCWEEAQHHITQHRLFSGQIVSIADQLREGQPVSRTDLLIFLNQWLRDHILGVDQALGRYLCQHMTNQSEPLDK